MYLSTDQLLKKIKSGAPITIGVDVKDAAEFGLVMDLYNEGIRKQAEKTADENIELMTKALVDMAISNRKYFFPISKPQTLIK